jgi:predicted DNA-binding transcriptional regulator AlpA
MQTTIEQPTIDQIKTWPAVIDIERAALALGISRSSLYVHVRENTCPVTVIRVGRRMKVLTTSLIAVLEGRSEDALRP